MLLVAGTSVATAQGANVGFGSVQPDPDAPVEVTADALNVDQETGEALFEGNVLVVQGLMRLSAPRLLVVYREQGGIERLEATGGGVTLVSGEDAAEADRADYSVVDGLVVMTGNVLLTQGPNVLTSERMTVNLVTGTAQMSGRVKTILNPESE
ncbi:MAG: lipopolysaccharide transport periplasmic protein LptA [Paracoccaceae bacterium]